MDSHPKPCPKCGDPETSWDGERYCAACESTYQKALERERRLTDRNFSAWVRAINI